MVLIVEVEGDARVSVQWQLCDSAHSTPGGSSGALLEIKSPGNQAPSAPARIAQTAENVVECMGTPVWRLSGAAVAGRIDLALARYKLRWFTRFDSASALSLRSL